MTASELLKAMARLRVLVVGDLCLDRWCYYEPHLSEPSSETGIPRIAVTRTDVTPGAAGTVAVNLASLGVGEVAVLAGIGNDGFGHELLQAMRGRRIGIDLLITEPAISTFTYTKVINASSGIEDKPRLDFIHAGDIPPRLEAAMCQRLTDYASGFDLVCVSDQAETERGGLITPMVRDCLTGIAEQGKLVWVDSRRRVELFRQVILKMNEHEAAEASARMGVASIRDLLATSAAPAVFVTHGGEGVKVITSSQDTWIATRREPNPIDICGAGDSFTAGAACALAAGATHEAAARLGHLVASITIMKKGTGFALPDELLEAERRLAT